MILSMEVMLLFVVKFQIMEVKDTHTITWFGSTAWTRVQGLVEEYITFSTEHLKINATLK